MTDLQKVLRRYRPAVFGGEAPVPEQNVDVAILRKDLADVITRSDVMLKVYIACLLVLFVADLVVFVRYMAEPKMIATILAATGVGFPLILTLLQKAWKQKFATQAFTAILPAIPSKDLPSVIEKLLASLS
jgi:hypothetical protein